jgi:hypothetical protein
MLSNGLACERSLQVFSKAFRGFQKASERPLKVFTWPLTTFTELYEGIKF